MTIQWCRPTEKQDRSVWYFKGEKCEVKRLGVADKRVKIIEVETARGDVVQVLCADGGYPGLEYEILH